MPIFTLFNTLYRYTHSVAFDWENPIWHTSALHADCVESTPLSTHIHAGTNDLIITGIQRYVTPDLRSVGQGQKNHLTIGQIFYDPFLMYCLLYY